MLNHQPFRTGAVTKPCIPSDAPRWRAINYDLQSRVLAKSAETFFKVAIEPTCTALAMELESITRGPTDDDVKRWDSLRNSQLELHRSFALALGGIWERHFRQHLSQSVTVLCPDKSFEDVEKADWDNLGKIFRKARGFSLSDFPSWGELELLHRVSSAVRHGNGRSTRSLCETNPELFENEPVTDWLNYFTLGGEPAHSVHKLEITFERLGTFKNAIVEFWLTVDRLRMSSERS